MPRSAKPRRPYRPGRQASRDSRPGLDETYRVFQPLRALFEQLSSGEVDSALGEAIMLEWEPGHYVATAPALEGWADMWERIAAAEQVDIDVAPFRRIANKLRLDSPLFAEEVQAGSRALEDTYRVFLRLPARVLAYHAKMEQASIELRGLSAAVPDGQPVPAPPCEHTVA